MAGVEQISNFVAAVESYRNAESIKSLAQLQRHIKILLVVSDDDVLAGDGRPTYDFYLCVHRLLGGLDVSSPLAAPLLRLLEHICTAAPAAVPLLRDRFYFLPLLSGLLGAQPNAELTVLLLGVIEALTVELNIERYEPFARPLLRALSELVCEGGERAAAALRCLSQLAAAGPRLTEALLAGGMRKRLVKALLSDGRSLLSQLHAAQLLLAIHPRCRSLPPQQLASFTDLVFSALGGGLEEGDVRLITQAGRLLAGLLTELTAEQYGKLPERLAELLHKLTPERHQLGGLLMPPLTALVRRGAGTSLVWQPAAAAAAQLIGRTDALEPAADLLVALLRRQLLPADGEETTLALSQLQSVLTGGGGSSGAAKAGCHLAPPSRACAAFRLLNELAAHASCRQALAEKWWPQLLQPVLHMLQRSFPSAVASASSNAAAAELAVALLELARVLGTESVGWVEALLEWQRLPSVVGWLGRALAEADGALVRRALLVLGQGGLPADCVEMLVDSLCSCRRASAAAVAAPAPVEAGLCRPPELSHETAECVDALISRLTQQDAELKDVSRVDLIELYEFKVASLSESVFDLEKALAASSEFHTSMKLQLAQTAAEGTAVRRLLLSAERRVETLHASQSAAEATAAAATATVSRLRQERDASGRELQAQHGAAGRAERELAARGESLRQAQRALADAATQRTKLEQRIAALTTQHDELRAVGERQLAALQERETCLQESSRALQQERAAVASLRTELSSMELLCRSQEQSLQERDTQWQKLTEENCALRKIQDMIHSISSKKDISAAVKTDRTS